jgi:hypothetical protein
MGERWGEPHPMRVTDPTTGVERRTPLTRVMRGTGLMQGPLWWVNGHAVLLLAGVPDPAYSPDPEVLVAAGGWCAPSLPIYDFFNIACAEGLLDLPTVNIQRGGIRFPLNGGPSISDVLDDIWLWTETNDILAVTGSGTKPCARPDCPTFDEERLECHGLCVTAGNLTERAYPELIDNFIRLTMDAHAHVISQRHIAQLVAASTSVLMASGTATELSTAIRPTPARTDCSTPVHFPLPSSD